LVGEGLPLAVALATMPFVVRGLGPARFGVLALAWVVLSYFGVFDLGLGRATTRFVAEALGQGRPERVPSLAWSAMLMQLGLGLAGGLVLAALAPVLVGHVLKVPPELAKETRAAISLLALAVPAVLVAGSLRGVLEAAQRFDLVNAVKAPFGAANFLIPLLGVVRGWGLPGIVALLVAARVAALGFLLLCCLTVFPGLRRRPTFARADARALFGFGGWITVSSVLSPILVYLDRFVLGAVVSLAAVAYYSAPYEMVTRLWMLPASLATTLFPAFSALSGQERPARQQAVAAQSLKYLLVVLGPVVALVAASARDLLHLWLGPDFAQYGTAVVQIIAVGVLVNSLAQVPYALVQADGRPDLTAKFHLAELVPHIVLSWVLVTALGVPGAAVAWTLRVTVDAALLFVAARRVSGLPLSSLLGARISWTVSLLTAFLLIAVATNRLMAARGERLLLLTAGFVATTAALWRWSLDSDDRSRFARLVGGAVVG